MAKPWADQPFKLLLIPGQPGARTTSNPDILHIAADMANVHNAIIRGLNAIYLQCPNIPNNASDINDFAFYVKVWADHLDHHHSMEETAIFPHIDTMAKEEGMGESVMNQNVEQHHQFLPGLTKLMDIVDKVYNGEKDYDWKEWRAILDEIAGVITQHLHEEVDTLLDLEKLEQAKELRQRYNKALEQGAKTANLNLILPHILGCIDKTQPGAENFPPVPFFVPWLSYLIFARKHKGCWRFNPCDSWSKPRELQFLGTGQ